MCGQRHTPAALLPGKRPSTHYTGTGWAPGPFWTDAENLVHTRFRSPDRPAHSEPLCRLSYCGPLPVSSLCERGIAKRFKPHALWGEGWGKRGGYLSMADWNDVFDNWAFFTLVQTVIYGYTYTRGTKTICHTINGTCLSREFCCGWHLSHFTSLFLFIMILHAKLPSVILPKLCFNTFHPHKKSVMHRKQLKL